MPKGKGTQSQGGKHEKVECNRQTEPGRSIRSHRSSAGLAGKPFRKAKKALDYLDDTAYLFHYLGKYIITDESLWLSEFGNGTMDSPFGFPRIELSRLEEVGPWLESVADELEEF